MKKKIIIVVNPDENKTEVYGTDNAWMDLAYILEGLGVICQANLDFGKTREEVAEVIQSYFNKVIVAGYKVKSKSQ